MMRRIYKPLRLFGPFSCTTPNSNVRQHKGDKDDRCDHQTHGALLSGVSTGPPRQVHNGAPHNSPQQTDGDPAREGIVGGYKFNHVVSGHLIGGVHSGVHLTFSGP
jgi:hypothetical protein